ncbi:MAG TPA: hypothetical protein VFR47_19320 [Anaerolineales bacterium]|nr:hypothetical protein [Anaerolineales bacterium]
MNTQTCWEIRSGMIALVGSSLLFVLGIMLRGPIPGVAIPASFSLAAASANYVAGWTVILVGFVLQLYGFFGLYRYLTYRAQNVIVLLAFVLRIVGLAFFLPLASFLAVNVPVIAKLYQQGNQEVLTVWEANSAGFGSVLMTALSIAAIIGAILFMIAIWRDGRLPKWTVVLLALSLPLLAGFTFTTELLGAVLLLISTATMAWKVWQESAMRTS